MSVLPRTNPSAGEVAPQDKGFQHTQNPAIELAHFEQTLRTNPTNIDMLLRASKQMQRAGHLLEASKLLMQAAALAPECPEIAIAQAELLRANALHEEAIDLLQHAIEKNPKVPTLWHASARTVLELADSEKACAYFDEALRLDTNFHLCRLERAALHLRKGRLVEALADYESLRQAVPNDPGVLVGWGDVKTAMGERNEARGAYAAALGLVRAPTPIVDRLQRLAIMEFSRPLPRADLPTAQSSANAGTRPDRIDIVFFHIDLPGTTASPFEKPDYQAMLAHAAAIARHRSPKARIVLLTDEHTRLPADLRFDLVIRNRADPARLMPERLRLTRDFLASGEAADGVVLLDSDVAVNRDPTEIFDGSFDVALTWRNNPPDAPFNAGVVLCRTGPAALRFYNHLLTTFDALEKYPAVIARMPNGGIRRWWGDQLAMAATVGWTEFARRKSDRLAVDGTAVRFLPADDYNFSIDPELSMPHGLNQRFFIHFKGSRKAGLGLYAKRIGTN